MLPAHRRRLLSEPRDLRAELVDLLFQARPLAPRFFELGALPLRSLRGGEPFRHGLREVRRKLLRRPLLLGALLVDGLLQACGEEAFVGGFRAGFGHLRPQSLASLGELFRRGAGDIELRCERRAGDLEALDARLLLLVLGLASPRVEFLHARLVIGCPAAQTLKLLPELARGLGQVGLEPGDHVGERLALLGRGEPRLGPLVLEVERDAIHAAVRVDDLLVALADEAEGALQLLLQRCELLALALQLALRLHEGGRVVAGAALRLPAQRL
mmetsp:Transcript_27439/g.79518  ORF Transcript_27439/g.79518 Transcript_27439/m.79518 type:complete len:271 (+) Transcript_27439:850-1662(+)